MHGLSVPVGKLGYHLPRTLSSAFVSHSASADPEEPQPPFRLQERVNVVRQDRDRRAPEEPPRPVFRIGGSIIQTNKPGAVTPELSSPIQECTSIGPEALVTEAHSKESLNEAEQS